jgi:GWxTD domain-containing protein
MAFKTSLKTIHTLIFSSMLLSTATAQQMQTKQQANHKMLQPQYHLYQYNMDSVMLWVQLNNDGLLFNNDSLQTAFVNINLFVADKVQTKNYLDLQTINFKVVFSDQETTIVKMYFAKPKLLQYVLKLEVLDAVAKVKVTDFKYINQAGLLTETNMIATDNMANPYLGNYIKTDDSINIYAATVPIERVWLRYFKFSDDLPLPPHVLNVSNTLSYAADSAVEINYTLKSFVFDKPGLYHIQADTLQKNGFTLLSFESDFPYITHAKDMLAPMRYITTGAEFDKLKHSENKSVAIQNFWTQLAGDKIKAKKLIASYYSNVQYANFNFTSYVPGWQTDMGLIYIIMGKPNSIEYNQKSITWSYQIINGRTLFFEFEKMNNPFSENDYMLQRNADFELPWYQAVNQWRQGQIR